MEHLPEHLKKYVVEQDQGRYTAVDQAGWRYAMRQLRHFLGTRAHESYLLGLDKTGISTERIPLISEISKNLEKFGWRALPVSGFIPPAAFMELQSLSVLPIASDMRSLDHLEYTPAPDIVHEAAGHAPMLINPEFAAYLHRYAEVANKALLSRQDLELYAAIRHLSDIKEHPQSTEAEIRAAQKRLDEVSSSMKEISEAGLLARMNWWTAEYGLIGDLQHPKIYGAGLLSSVGESKWCLSDKVKKLPLTIECIHQAYDITEPQPQLFVTPDFAHLSRVLEEMSQRMAYRIGGREGLDRAIRAGTVCTAELDSGLQISGVFESRLPAGDAEASADSVVFLKTRGPTQLSFEGKELAHHGISRHAQGFSSPLGPLRGESKALSEFSTADMQRIQFEIGREVRLSFASGLTLTGEITAILSRHGRNILATFRNACLTGPGNERLFDPSWGEFDLALGNRITSVFGRAADPKAYGETQDFPASRVRRVMSSPAEKKREARYAEIRQAREDGLRGAELQALCERVESEIRQEDPQDWLLRLEILELLAPVKGASEALVAAIRASLQEVAERNAVRKELIAEGLRLLGG